MTGVAETNTRGRTSSVGGGRRAHAVGATGGNGCSARTLFPAENDPACRPAYEGWSLFRLRQASEDNMSLLLHDIRNSLAVAKGYLSLMQACPGSVDSRDVDAASEACDSATRTMDEASDLRRLRDLRTPTASADVRLDGELAEVISAFGPSAERMGKELRLASADEVLWAKADPALLRKVLTTLVAEALRNAKGRFPVTVELAHTRGEVYVSVNDDGPSIPAGFRQAVFSPYEQGEVKRASVRRGRGLSLVFASLAARRMGGELRIGEPAPRSADAGNVSGCRFTLVLRRTKSQCSHRAVADRLGRDRKGACDDGL